MDATNAALRICPAPLFASAEEQSVVSAVHPSRDRTLIRVRAGVYTPRSAWEALLPWDRYLLRVHAYRLIRPDAVFSHESAATLSGLPTFGHPRKIHIFDGRRTRSLSYGDVTVHTSADGRRIHEDAGMRITSVGDTVLDLLRVLPPAFGLAVVDAAMRDAHLDRDDLWDLAGRQRNAHGRRRVEWALRRGTGLAESVGESVSRAVIEWCGYPTPELQVEHLIEGRTFRSDFCWPEERIIGESDGWLKYSATDPSAAAEALRAEKRREDALRRAGWTVARWDYKGAIGVDGLRAALSAAGLSPAHRGALAALRTAGRNPRST
ncbi:hypothetical protein RWH45_11450 [Microbacterium sp. KSW4-17]|uniref:Transcriptional regulator, AbiEi antitoxin, Type IV TA system n=1 Tax=Microbacterium galbum TaxID=3075994 RepID=A0ABU3T8Z6_9MICO|nr:hypothetical protein [Microbacterium sp. KSW4-17]MDU0367832.1 hypothetical protein [Microbacterium sp. KSW4-17]